MQERDVASALEWDVARTLAAPADGVPAAVHACVTLLLDISCADDFAIMRTERLMAKVNIATGVVATILAQGGGELNRDEAKTEATIPPYEVKEPALPRVLGAQPWPRLTRHSRKVSRLSRWTVPRWVQSHRSRVLPRATQLQRLSLTRPPHCWQ